MSLIRKFSQLYEDPVLRLWFYGWLLGKWKFTPIYKLSPDYLVDTDLPEDLPSNANLFEERCYRKPVTAENYEFAGECHKLDPDLYKQIDERYFVDIESKLSFHRFSWVTQAEKNLDPDWVVALWVLWVKRYSEAFSSQAWHPYTVSERLINILQFSGRFGLPEPKDQTIKLLLQHGRKIYQNLEYYGEIHTGNHLANNGRGLYLGGLMLGITSWVDIGCKILLEEARRIFSESGELKEGSVHYHLLVSRWYIECWLAAKKHGRKEKPYFERIASSVLSVLPIFNMPAGLPLIGDVSPDCSPSYLHCLLDDTKSGWVAELSPEEQQALLQLKKNVKTNDLKTHGLKNWRRTNVGSWAAIWHSTLDGWQPLPGHGHQDFSGFELHYDKIPVFIDLGRRSYGITGESDKHANSHNILTIDGMAPYPENKPYYSDEFRKSVTGAEPIWERDLNNINVETNCFSRIKGIGGWRRSWKFTDKEVTISDTIEGRGRHKILRYLHTPHPTRNCDKGVIFGPFKVSGSGKPALEITKYWKSYGKSEEAMTIIFSDVVSLPSSLSLTVSFERAV
jgi:hypothetical protein